MKVHPLLIASLAVPLSGVTAHAQQQQETAPVSVGIVLDTSGSMAFKLAKARQIVSELMKFSNSLDEFTVIQASDRPIALSGFVPASGALQTLTFTQAK